MIPNTTILAISSGVLGLLAVVFLAGSRLLSPEIRRYGYVAVLASGAMSVTYLLMSAEVLTVSTSGTDESVVRFIGYTVVWAGISYVLGAVADAGQRKTAAVFGCSLVTLWGTFASWLVSGLAGTVVSLGIVLGFVGLVYLLVGPVSRTAAATSEHRELLYSKLEYLILLSWAGLIMLGLLSEQNLGLTGSFVGQIAASYVDLVLLVGFGGLVLRNTTALEQTAATTVLLPFFDGDDTGETATSGAETTADTAD
ncbi:bacteriorhodopsin [Natronobacterium texcoconense]|uniref:Bacteriorhodopsin-like protein n=1 Tax=Natronobacterium texcoconense TaxID=1095778 RepID=A0A1H1FRT4_NATTX|nr:bacteriorhodopsin [Natronobacterium texcoconense]SDR03712.1 Bacteriorhodopsin-like protein [Natronobacterium texcoconense]